MFYTVYILFSEKHNRHYVGFSSDVDMRLRSHNGFGKDWTSKYRSESRLWTLMARKLAREATQDKLIELEVLVQKSPDAHYVIEILTLWWELSEKSGKEHTEQAVADLLSQLERQMTHYT